MSRPCILAHAFDCYPESTNIDLLVKVLDSIGVAYTYILHDQDTKPDGSLKKPHYHFMFSHVLSAKQKSVITKGFSISYFESIHDPSEYYLYLTHSRDKDAAEGKHRYLESDRHYGSVYYDWDDLPSTRASVDPNQVCIELTRMIRDNDIIFYKDLVNWVMDNKPDYMPIVVRYSHYFKNYMSSMEYVSKSCVRSSRKEVYESI